MAINDKEIQHECWYRGSHEQNNSKCFESKPVAPAAAFAQAVALGILGGRTGRYHPGQHFRNRMEERDFDVFDMEYVIRNGKCVGEGKYCEDFRNFKYTFRGNLEGTDFDAVFALSADHDYIESPLMVLITGCFKTASGKRSGTY